MTHVGQYPRTRRWRSIQHRGIDLPVVGAGIPSYSYSGVPKTEAGNVRTDYLTECLAEIQSEFHRAVLAGILTATGVARVKELFPEILADELLQNSAGISQENSWINCCGTVTTIPSNNSGR